MISQIGGDGALHFWPIFQKKKPSVIKWKQNFTTRWGSIPFPDLKHGYSCSSLKIVIV